MVPPGQRWDRRNWLRYFPPAQWLTDYHAASLREDAIAGVTVAAYAIPVSLAYAGLAGLSPQVGVYGYLLGGLGYAVPTGSGATSPAATCTSCPPGSPNMSRAGPPRSASWTAG